jgi:hypothetical protein
MWRQREKFIPLAGIESQPSSQQQVTLLTELSQLTWYILCLVEKVLIEKNSTIKSSDYNTFPVLLFCITNKKIFKKLQYRGQSKALHLGSCSEN